MRTAATTRATGKDPEKKKGEKRGGEQWIQRKAEELLKGGPKRERETRREIQSYLTAGRIKDDLIREDKTIT